MVPCGSHEVHASGAPLHVWHVALQLMHVPIFPSILRNNPGAQGVVHVPVLSSYVAPAGQAVQLDALPAVQVAQDTSHARHSPLAMYL